MLAILAGVLLSFAAPAMADYYFKIDSVEVDDIYDAAVRVNQDVTVSFYVTVSGVSPSTSGYYKNANVVKWEVAGASTGSDSDVFTVKSTTVTNTDVENQNAANQSYYRFTKGITADDNTAMGPTTLRIDVTGTLLKTTGTFPVKVYLCNSDGTTNGSIITTDAAAETARKVDASENASGEIEIHAKFDYENDPANPEGAKWDGKDPVFESDPGNNATAKAKPKLGKIEKEALTFTSGTAGELTIPISGPVTEVDVYVAAKDAIKLGWLPKGSTKNIRLDQDNIAEYQIPFRITSYDFSGNTGLTGATDKDGKKADKETAKNMSSTLTLAFNGGYFSYKGFPVTVSLKNKQTSKPVAKAVKINVEPNTDSPQWWFNDYHNVETALTNVPLVTENAEGVRTAREFEAGDTLTGAIISFDEEARYTDYVNGGDLAFTLSTGNAYYDAENYVWKVSDDVGDATDVTATVSGTHIEYNEPYDHVIDTKSNPADKKLEIAIPLVAGDENLGKLSEAAEHLLTYYISGDYGPFVITQKGADKTKNGIEVTITSPDFNYRGEIGKDNEGEDTGNIGSVTFGGKLTKTDKESKTAVTLTVTNPMTKKKGTAKITVIGKVPASFDVKKYPVSKDDDNHRWFTTKPVEAGKVPSVKPKAIGSKTITYYVDDLEALNEVGLSFDEKKGAVIDYPKGSKNTIPTSNDGVYEPIEVIIYATNEVGGEEDASVHTMMGITGAKPSLNVKKVEFAGNEYVNGTIKTFALNAGKAKPVASSAAGANVIVSPDAAGKKTLEGLGLEMITWKSVMALESTDTEATDNMEIVPSGDKTPYKLLSGDKETVLAENVYDSGAYTEKVASGAINVSLDSQPAEITAVWLRKGSHETTEPDENYKNLGIIRVADASKMKETKKAKINVTLDNIGAAGKGTVELNIAAKASTDNTGALPANAKAVYVAPESTASTPVRVKAKNGSASYQTYLDTKAKAEAENGAEGEEAGVTFGAPRTLANLTAEQNAFFAKNGYTVVAVLPEITVEEDGQYDISAELDENAPEGAKLLWFAFPDKATHDEDIVDFYDEAGTPVEGVPASHKIIASPWLNAGVKYAPVIAIEAE